MTPSSPAFLALPPLPRTRRRRPRLKNPSQLICCSTPPTEGDPSLRLLHERISNLRDQQVRRDRQLAHAWRNASYHPSIIAAIPNDYVRKLAFHGDLLAFGTASGATAFTHIPSQSQLVASVHTGQTTALDFRDGYLTSVASADTRPAIWDLRAASRQPFWRDDPAMPEPVILPAHDDLVTALRLDVPRNRLYSASVDGTVRVHDLAGQMIHTIRVGEPVLALLLTPDPYLLLACASGCVQAYQPDSTLHLLSLSCHPGNTTALDFCHDTHTLVTGDASGAISLWDLKDGSQKGELPSHDSAVMSLQLDGAKVVSAGRDGCVAVASMQSKQRFYSMHGFTKYLACAKFDDARLITDGTNDVIVCHNFDANLNHDERSGS